MLKGLNYGQLLGWLCEFYSWVLLLFYFYIWVLLLLFVVVVVVVVVVVCAVFLSISKRLPECGFCP